MRPKLQPMQAPELSLVAPMYNEEEVVDHFFSTVKPILEQCTQGFEIVCVNDGSRDATWSGLLSHAESDDRIKLIDLSRNFGKEIALTAGLDHTRGRAVIPIDCDLQDPPELIPKMLDEWRKGSDVVLAKRVSRKKDTLLKRATSKLFYLAIDTISDISIPRNVGDFRLLDEKVVSYIRAYPERTRFMKGIFASLGFSESVVEYERPERAAGTTKWNYFQLYKLAIEGFVSFSSMPLKIWSYLGATIALSSFAFGVVIVAKTLIHGRDVPGYASLMVVVLFMFGLVLLSLGIIGEYLARIFVEVKGRPVYIVRETIGEVRQPQ